MSQDKKGIKEVVRGFVSSSPTWHWPLINMKKSVFLPLWDNYKLYGCKILHIERFSAIESDNLVSISKFFI